MSLLGALYLAALIVGGGVNLLQLVMAGIGGDGDAGAHADEPGAGELVGAAGDGTLDVVSPEGAGAPAGVDAGFLPLVLSLRFWTFGLLAFGLFGAPVHFLGLAPWGLTLAVAVVLGLGLGGLSSWVFRALAGASTQSGAVARDAVGQVGRVLVPVGRGGRGKVRIQLRGQTVDYLASSDEEALEAGAEVLVAEVCGEELRVCRAPTEFRGPSSEGPGPRSGD